MVASWARTGFGNREQKLEVAGGRQRGQMRCAPEPREAEGEVSEETSRRRRRSDNTRLKVNDVS